MIVSPCNGLKRCWRHPTGCARIVISAQEEYALIQKRKARRRRLWNIILEHYRIGAKWGLDPIPPRYQLQTVLLMEQVLGEEKLWQSIEERQSKIRKDKRVNIEKHAG